MCLSYSGDLGHDRRQKVVTVDFEKRRGVGTGDSVAKRLSVDSLYSSLEGFDTMDACCYLLANLRKDVLI